MAQRGGEVRLHGVALDTAPARALAPVGGLAPLVGPFERVVARLSGDDALIREAGRGLPEGAAWAEAVAVRLRRQGATLVWAEPDCVDRRSRAAFARARGRSSVLIMRADPALLTEMQAGSWFNAYAGGRVVRRSLLRVGVGRLARSRVGERTSAWALDAAFWRGVRDEADDGEWARLTSGYTALIYHRMAGERRRGQEELDLPPQMFRRQMHLLRLLGFHAIQEEQILRFHAGEAQSVPRRAYVVTVDDGFADCLAPLTATAAHHPLLFVPTGVVGGVASWADGERIAGWEELGRLEAAGVRVGSHAQSHRRLPELDTDEIAQELRGALADLEARLTRPSTLAAYPHGAHNPRVREAAVAAGHAGAWTTQVGRNGAGTDRHCLRRVGVKARDSRLSFLWKVLTGELPPRPWEQRRRRRSARL